MKRNLTIATAALAMLAMTGCQRINIGDSIFALSQPSGDHTDSQAGRGAYNQGVDQNLTHSQVVATLVPYLDPGGVLVMEEDGTYDNGAGISGEETPESYRRFVDEVVAVLPDDRCLVWVLPFNVFAQERDAAFAAQIEAGLQAQPWSATVPWNQIAAANPHLLADGLHPNQAGANALNAAIDAAIAERC
jgi:hypothetical protein